MHSNLAVTTEGLPLGLTTVKFWTRKKFKGTAALKKKINGTRVPIEKESIRWLDNVRQSTELLGDPGRRVHVGDDRESDIYELFCTAREAGTHFVIRTCGNRLAGHADHTIVDEMDEVVVKGLHCIDVRNNNGDPDEAVLEIRYRKFRVLPPIGKQKRYPELSLTVIHAEECWSAVPATAVLHGKSRKTPPESFTGPATTAPMRSRHCQVLCRAPEGRATT
ncbi:hypothetical protein ABIA85_009621 [Bradyrhizobium sp. LA6.10]|uniref:hypothetical protein n=1 Tax=Bradyrhizobium sp. LA6.10 TaxID=3156318 RepID=UPI0033968916